MADEWNVSGGKCWNDTNRGKLKCVDSNLLQFHFVHHKSHRDWPRIEPGPVWWKANDLTAWAVGNLWIYFPWMHQCWYIDEGCVWRWKYITICSHWPFCVHESHVQMWNFCSVSRSTINSVRIYVEIWKSGHLVAMQLGYTNFCCWLCER